MRATRADVAKRAGVSVATVTYVLNGTCPVKEETRRKVLSAARELYYVPDMRARSMATNRTMQLGVIVPSLTDPVDCEIIDAFIHAAAQNGYFVNVSIKGRNIRQNIHNIISQHVDGVFLLLTPEEIEVDMIFQLADTEIKIVAGMPLLSEKDREHASTVQLAHAQAFLEAADYLGQHGHEQIAFLCNTCNENRESRLLAIYREAAGQRTGQRISFHIDDQRHISPFEAGRSFVGRLFGSDDPFSAVLVSDDGTAQGVISALGERGFAVPADVSVMSLSGSTSGVESATITAMVPDYNAYAELSFRVLQDSINGNVIEHHVQPLGFRKGQTVAHRK